MDDGDMAKASAGEGMTLLSRVLSIGYGSEDKAREVVNDALQRSRRPALPDTGPELLAFVQAYLLKDMTVQLGDALAGAIIDELRADLEDAADSGDWPQATSNESERPTVPTPVDPGTPVDANAVVLIDRDRVRRPAMARALVRAGFDVTSLDEPTQLAEADGARAGAVIAWLEYPTFVTLLVGIAPHPHRRYIVCSAKGQQAEAALRSAGAIRFAVIPVTAPPDEIIAKLR
jgi:hypothetical protein